MIDTSSWVKFKLSDIGFNNYHGIRQTKADRKEGDIPLLTAGKENQGVASYISNAPSVYTDAITVDMFGNSFFHKGNYAGDDNIYFFINDKISDNAKLFITAILNTDNSKIYAYKEQFRQPQADALSVSLPATSDGQPDWDYMESYMKAVMEESEKSLESLRKADNTKHLIDVSGWGEFKLSNLFTKKTMKGYPKKAESYEEVENGYHIYGQNIGWQYPYKVLMDEQYLHKVESDKPILAYTSSVGEIGLINESFYRSGDNGAFQGLFPIGYHPNLLQMQFVLSILKKEFEAFRYDTSMQNTMDITFKLPITSTGEPDWQYMEDYMRRIMDKSEQIISDLQIGA